MWSGIPISFRIFQFIVIHTVKGIGIANKGEIDIFLELSCFFDDPADVGNLIAGSSAFSKTSLGEVIDISSGTLDSSLCFFQPCVSHDVFCIQQVK